MVLKFHRDTILIKCHIAEFSEPAAIVYDIMTKKLSKLERRIQRLENTQCDCNKYYTASEVEQLTRDTRAHILQIVNDRSGLT